MKFIHAASDFADLVRIVGAEHQPAISAPLVEKDYWVTHALWSLQQSGLQMWFKGGTSLSKGFGLIQRFSEDLDLKLDAGTVSSVPHVANWKSDGKQHVDARRAFFAAVARALKVSGARVEVVDEEPVRANAQRSPVAHDWRSAAFHIRYPSIAPGSLPPLIKPFVLIEAGNARVVPSVERDLSSFVHDALARRNMLGEFTDNRPRQVACVHPVVTLIEKLDAITKRFEREEADAGTFVRHYEDAARVVEAIPNLPELPRGVAALVAQMLAAREVKSLPSPSHPAFQPSSDARWEQVRLAYDQAEILFFGPRLGLAVACARIRGWLKHAGRDT